MKVYTAAPQGCVLSPSYFTLCTSDGKNTHKLYSSTSKVTLLKYYSIASKHY